MNKTKVTLGGTDGVSELVRPTFQAGMLLQHEDLELLSTYTRELSRLMFRSLFGCGVVCGLAAEEVGEECGKVAVTVRAGLALNCSGDPVHVPKDQRLLIGENCDSNIEGPLWIVLCGATKHCAPRTSMCASDDEATSACTRVRDMFEIQVLSGPPKCACGCGEPKEYQGEERRDHCQCVDPTLDCYKDHYAGKCGCNCGDDSDCGCECILLARLYKGTDSKWEVDHGVRRFIRPVLMRDPLGKAVARPPDPKEEEPRKAAEEMEYLKMQLSELTEENYRLKEQLNKVPEVKRTKQVQKEAPKTVEEKA